MFFLWLFWYSHIRIRLVTIQFENCRRSMADGLPRLKDIELFHKKIARHSKEERLASVASGRAGRQEFNKPKKVFI